MRGQAETSVGRVTSCQRRLGSWSGKDALLLALLVLATASVVLLGVGLQLSSPREGDGAPALDVEALITTMRQSTARCTSERIADDRQTQSDATRSTDE